MHVSDDFILPIFYLGEHIYKLYENIEKIENISIIVIPFLNNAFANLKSINIMKNVRSSMELLEIKSYLYNYGFFVNFIDNDSEENLYLLTENKIPQTIVEIYYGERIGTRHSFLNLRLCDKVRE